MKNLSIVLLLSFMFLGACQDGGNHHNDDDSHQDGNEMDDNSNDQMGISVTD